MGRKGASSPEVLFKGPKEGIDSTSSTLMELVPSSVPRNFLWVPGHSHSEGNVAVKIGHFEGMDYQPRSPGTKDLQVLTGDSGGKRNKSIFFWGEKPAPGHYKTREKLWKTSAERTPPSPLPARPRPPRGARRRHARPAGAARRPGCSPPRPRVRCAEGRFGGHRPEAERPIAPSRSDARSPVCSFLFLVVRPGAPSSIQDPAGLDVKSLLEQRLPSMKTIHLPVS